MEQRQVACTGFLLLALLSAVHGLCEFGAIGICGRVVPFPCPGGSTCRYIIPGAPIGLCCLNSPDRRCPAPSSMVSTCAFNVRNLRVECMNNNDCSNGQVCCPEACGAACKNPVS